MRPFEELSVWKKSANLCVDVYRAMRTVRDRSYREQVCRSALSISSNIAEGYERSTPKDTANFLRYAKGSAGELRSQLRIGARLGYISGEDYRMWTSELEQISRMLFGLSHATKKRAL